jgi:hypothetical protein
VTALDLTEDERRRLNGAVEQVIRKGAYDRDELLREVARLLAVSIDRGERPARSDER